MQQASQERLAGAQREPTAGHAARLDDAFVGGEVVRLQMLLQSRDKRLDEVTATLRQALTDASNAQSEAEVLKHQLRVMQKDVAQRTEEVERGLRCENDLRAEVFAIQAKLERAAKQGQEDARRAAVFAETACIAEERQRRIEQLEAQLAEETAAATREREQMSSEAEFRLAAKEQTIKHQTSTIESLTRELKEKQAEVDRLVKIGRDLESPRAAYPGGAVVTGNERGGLLPPIQPASPRADDTQSQRSIESLHRQLKTKDIKIGKQSELLQVLTDMLEKRDQQLDELASAKRDRAKMQQQVAELEQLVKTHPRAVTHAEAERRLIEQEERIRQEERHAAAERAGAPADAARVVAQAAPHALPALQRRLQQLEEADRALGRDVAMWLQDKETKIETLNSTVTLLRHTVDELRTAASAKPSAPALLPAPASAPVFTPALALALAPAPAPRALAR